eukprot:gene3518-4019_t
MLSKAMKDQEMRDDPPRVGRPRKGTQRKPRERPERFKAGDIQGTYQLDHDVDFHAPLQPRNTGSRRIASPVHVLTSPTSISSTAMSIDSASSDMNPYEENDNNQPSHDALCAFCNCGSEMAQILGQLSRYYPSPDFDPFLYEEMYRSRDHSRDQSKDHARDQFADRLHDQPKDPITEMLSTVPIRPEKRSVGRPPGKKKKRGRHPIVRQQHLTADMSTFGAAQRPEIPDVFDPDGCLWAHHCCAAWSAGVCQTDSYDLENVDKAAFKALSEQCCHCKRHGASVECQIQKCSKLYHYPCCASAGAFQDIKSMVLLCPDHLDQAGRLAGPEAACVLCDKAGDIAKQLFCTSCGRHYHGRCLDPPVAISAIVRMGWQCPECKVCQGCRQPGDDEKMLFCDECDKGFHTYCLSPPMSSVPKTAWKCYRCRKCEDCGSNVPGSGPSCRWHFNYTVCDRCYQQRKKSCCPMCGKAVRNITGEPSRQCVKCTKFIHVRCDKSNPLAGDVIGVDYYCPDCKKEYQHPGDTEFPPFMDQKDESNDSLMLSPVHSSTTNDLDSEYLGQRTVTIAEAEAISRTATGFFHREPSPLLKQNEMEDLDLKGMDINFDEVMMESGLHEPLIHDLDELKPDSSDSFSSPPHISSSASYSQQFSSSEDRQNASRVTSSSVTSRPGRGKKKMSPFRCRGRPPGSTGRGKKNKNQRVGRPRSKGTPNTGPNKENVQTGTVATVDNNKKDEADEDAEGLHSTVIMVSTKDTFSLGQDICMCCGSFGKGNEGHLITCAHCGQCFHPYCVNVKINKVLMTKGWRCLDCTVCEGCGKNEDEGKLLLCDGCDISFHIYCLDPPLDEVPPDGWKCQWCVECTNCGATDPGVGCKWMSSYTQCGPCASETSCCVCNKTYLDDELVIKCTHCSRWLHADCDGLASEDDSELAASYGYHCCLCREKTGHYGIFSSSWTRVVEKGVYSSSPNKLTTQTVIVTQTTTTVMATGVSNRKSKAFGTTGTVNLNPNRSPASSTSSFTLPSLKQGAQRKPLHPVQTSMQGTFEVKLQGLRVKSRKGERDDSDIIHLTELGVREIKSQIVKAPSKGVGRTKDKMSSASKPSHQHAVQDDVNLDERETKTSGQLTKTTVCSEDTGEMRQPICLPAGAGSTTETGEEYHVESEVESRVAVMPEKRPPGRPPHDKKHEKNFYNRDDPIDFFGTSLLKVTRKKRKKETQPDNDTQSSEEDEMSNAAENVAMQQPSPRNQTGHFPSVASYSELGMPEQQQGSSTPVSKHGSWPSKISAGMTVDPLSDEMQHSDSLYKTLNMLVSGTEDVESQPGRELQHEQHSSQQKSQQQQQHYASSSSSSAKPHRPSRRELNESTASLAQNADLTPTGDLDLIGLSDLPHVEGHEVEEIFAGIEREMSVDGTPRSQDHSPMETSLHDFPKTESGSFNNRAVQLKQSIETKPGQFQGQPGLKTARPGAATDSPGYPDTQQQRVQLGQQQQQQDYRQYEMYRNNPASFPQTATYDQQRQAVHATGQTKPPPPPPQPPLGSGSSGGGHSGETDAFKAVFGEEPEIKSKSRDGATSPKIDGQKQLKKWEQDETLGELATISPVLYANIVHPKLKVDYPEWPNRARAIARLWRKLPQEQREPFRLRARDNRVKQKDQGRKLGNFKKPSSTPTTDMSVAFSNASPSLSSDNSDKGVVQSVAETTAIDVLSNNLLLNGGEAANSTGMMRTQLYHQQQQQQQNVSHSYVPKQESQFPDTSPGYSHESGNHGFGPDDHDVFRQTHGQFMTGASDDRMNDPMLLQTRSSSVVSPSIASLQKSQQSMARTAGRLPSDNNSKSFSFSDLCSPTTPSDMHFPAAGLTPTTPVFPSSPFQTTPYGADASGSPAGFMSPSLPIDGNLNVEKKGKSKKQVKISKEQLEVEREKKKKKLAMEQEKERQWKVLQQQRLKEQAYQQTPAIQQVLMMKEQMRKDNNKTTTSNSNKKSQDYETTTLRSNVLPPVEPFNLTPTSVRSVEDRSKSALMNNKQATDSLQATGQPSAVTSDALSKEHVNIPIPASLASHLDYFKDDINIPTDQASIDRALFLTKETSGDLQGNAGGDTATKISADGGQTPLDRLLEISSAEFAKIGNERPQMSSDGKSRAVVTGHHPSVNSSSVQQQLVSTSDISVYTSSSQSFAPMQQTSMDQRSQQKMIATSKEPIELQQSKDSQASGDTTLLHRQNDLSMSEHQHVAIPAEVANQSDSNQSMHVAGQSNASQMFNLMSGQAMPPGTVNMPESIDNKPGFDQQQQQQALLFQQQQFMAAQQQYIQWQLQQRNPELFQPVQGQMPYSAYADKELPEVDSEEQHQERIRFLYRQRQMQKQQVVQIQQQLQQHQLMAPSGATATNPVVRPPQPPLDPTQQQFMQQLLQQQQQTPDAMQQQFMMEYNRQMQQRSDGGQNAIQYEKFMAEFAQQYGYASMQSSNAHAVSMMQHGIPWQGGSGAAVASASQGMNPGSAQQMFGFGVDEEKTKDLTPQQLYQMQLQHTFMMHQMAASGMYPSPSSSSARNQSPVPAGTRKGAAGSQVASSQDRSKKPREVKKVVTSQEKLMKPGDTAVQQQNVAASQSGDSTPLPTTKQDISVQGSSSFRQTSDSSQSRTSIQESSNASVSKNIDIVTTSSEKSDRTQGNSAPVTVSALPGVEAKTSQERAAQGIAVDVDASRAKSGSPHLHPVSAKSHATQVDTIGSITGGKVAAIQEASMRVPHEAVVSRSDVVNNVVSQRLLNAKATEKDSTVCSSVSSQREGVDSMDTVKTVDINAEVKDRAEKTACTDGIHCGTDDEEEGQQNAGIEKSSGLPVFGSDGGGSNSDGLKAKAVCTDGIHCGTDDEGDQECDKGMLKEKQFVKKMVCEDGIHCGTDSEDDGMEDQTLKMKSVCSDGIHCGTDSEDDEEQKKKKGLEMKKAVCTDGIHCGTDSEDESEDQKKKGALGQAAKQVCTDGIHCGTDSEDEGAKEREHGDRNKEDVDVASQSQAICSDGIHCGTDSEDETCDGVKSVKQTHHSKTNNNEKSIDKTVCSDVMHFGLGSENKEDDNTAKGSNDLSKGSSENQGNLPMVQSEQQSSTSSMGGDNVFSSDQTLEVMQEGDVAVNSFSTMDIVGMRDASKSSTKLSGSVEHNFAMSSHKDGDVGASSVKEEQRKGRASCVQGGQEKHEQKSAEFSKLSTALSAVKSDNSSSSQMTSSAVQNIMATSLMAAATMPGLHQSQQQALMSDASSSASAMPSSLSAKMQQSELLPPSLQQSMRDANMPPNMQQMFSPTPQTAAMLQHQQSDAQNRQRAQKIAAIPPMSPQYQKQYQYQLQAQFQQLSQQQMSPQQQFLLQQQYHQQIVLLQRQFVQQQSQLQAMASAGMQFTEQELAYMYQQQMVAQQAYNHWIATLSLDQQGQLHARMQANMQQLQQALAATLQSAPKSTPEGIKDKSKKPRGRRPRKSKTDASDPATPAPNTPSLPPTPASGGDAAALPLTPNKDQANATELMNRNRTQRSVYPPDGHSFSGPGMPAQAGQMAPDFMADRRQGNQQLVDNANSFAAAPAQATLPMQPVPTADQSQSYPSGKPAELPAYHQGQQAGINQQHLMQMQSREWQQSGGPDARQLSQQPSHDIAMQQQSGVIGDQDASASQQLPRVSIIPGGSNPFSDIYREMEIKKSKDPLPIGTTTATTNAPAVDLKSITPVPGSKSYPPPDQWKNLPPGEEFRQPGSGNSTPRIPSASVHSESAFYYPSPSGPLTPSMPPQPGATSVYPPKSRVHAPGIPPQDAGHRMYPEQQAAKMAYDNTQAQYFDQNREHQHLMQDAQNSPLQSSMHQNQPSNAAQFQVQSTVMSQLDSNVPPVYRDSLAIARHGQQSVEQSYMATQQGRPIPVPSSGLQGQEVDAVQQYHRTQQSVGVGGQTGPTNERLMPPPPPSKYDGVNDKSALASYPMAMNQQQQPTGLVPKPDADQDVETMNRLISTSDSNGSREQQTKALQKRKRGSQPSQVATANVDFSLLNPEEQKRFILERKREDFERRRRIIEDQKQQKLKEQRSFKQTNRKIEKKLPRAKQQRKLKSGRDKLGVGNDKSPLPSGRLILDDKSLKLPLCEPEVHLLYPLVQPYGSGGNSGGAGYTNGETLLFGVFGNARVQGNNDYYSQFPSPDPPVTSSNPPTPPASLPPSPGTINQSLRDSLQMIPTEGIFEDLALSKPSKDEMTLFSVTGDSDIDSPFYSPGGHVTATASSSSAVTASTSSKDNNDVMVTLTMSTDSSRTATDRVSNVADILGVAKPNRIKIAEGSSAIAASGKSHVDNSSLEQRPLATSIGKEKDVHFSCLDSSDNTSNDAVKNKAPFCKHCDISIQGSGYIECSNDEQRCDNDNLRLIRVDDMTYKKIPITAGQELFDVFCSQLCLRSFHSLSRKPDAVDGLRGGESAAGTDDSGRLIDPVRSVIPVSTGESSGTDYADVNADDVEMRGTERAERMSPRLVRRRSNLSRDGTERDVKRPRYVIWKRWRIEINSKKGKQDPMHASVIELLEKYGAALKVGENTKDNRQCMLCGDKGDGVTEGTARLINYDVDVWVHLNCALWSLEVYETLNGALHNVQKAYERGIQTACVSCGRKGATVTCARVIGAQMRRCEMNYHFNCAIKAHCIFFKDKTVLCPQHKNYGPLDQRLPSYAVLRKVYINRDITKQLASVLRLNNEKEQKAYTIRIGSLIFHELGQLLPHQLQKFHTKEAIYPIGFQTTRIYWSTSKLGKRCRYICTVNEQDSNPHFTVTVESGDNEIGQYAGRTPKEVWSYILDPVRKVREDAKMVKIFPEFMTGEDLFGLHDPSLQRIIESLPGVDTFHDYSFRFGRTPMIMAELPLAVNPSGCIRSESTRHVHLNRPVSLRTASSSDRGDRIDSFADDSSQGSMLRNNWAMTKTAQYRKLKSDWKNIVLLSKSRIQGLGLFATRDIEPNTMIIEYIGSIIRNEVANKRERIYEDANRGVYMFRVDSDTVIDATMTGGPARYINHSCDPNCVAEVVVIEKMPKIIIISNRKIEQGEELTYDYKFEFEDDQHKIACLCGAANCRKWMN